MGRKGPVDSTSSERELTGGHFWGEHFRCFDTDNERVHFRPVPDRIPLGRNVSDLRFSGPATCHSHA